MHAAPSVSYPVGRSLFAALFATALWVAGAAVTLAWAWIADAPGWRQASASGGVAITGAFALLAWLRSPAGELKWDGSSWSAPGMEEAGALVIDVAVDLQRVLLVRCGAVGDSRWLWLERRRCPHRWMDLRRAVYSRARPHALPPAHPPAATP